MINADKGHISLKGEGITLMAELSTIARALLKTMQDAGAPKELAVKELKRAVDFAVKDGEERTAEISAAKDNLKGTLKALLSEVLGDD